MVSLVMTILTGIILNLLLMLDLWLLVLDISNARHVQKEKEPFLIDRKYKVGER